MLSPESISLDLGRNVDEVIAALPDAPALFLLWPAQGEPYFARTTKLRRRIARLLRQPERLSALLNLRGVAERLEYWPVRSSLGGLLLQFAVARRHFPDSYETLLKLRWPHYVKLLEANRFPRLQVTSRLTEGSSFYGPFPSRPAAELFEAACLDQFLLRRCQEQLEPSPQHPGCIYGEMQKCLRPCQAAVSDAQYGDETARVREYLESSGESLLRILEDERDHASADLDFELAARLHQRLEKARLSLPPAHDLPRLIDRLHGLCVAPVSTGDYVEIWPVAAGCWQEPLLFSTEYTGPQARSIDARLREVMEARTWRAESQSARAQGLALLSRWFYSSWREGEWLAVDDWSKPPYRKLVNAIGRVSRSATPSSVAAE